MPAGVSSPQSVAGSNPRCLPGRAVLCEHLSRWQWGPSTDQLCLLPLPASALPPAAHPPTTAVTTERRQERREGVQGGGPRDGRDGRAGTGRSTGQAEKPGGVSGGRPASQPGRGTGHLCLSCIIGAGRGLPPESLALVWSPGMLKLRGDTWALSPGPAPAERR